MDELQENMISLYGNKGKSWIEALPQIIKEYQEKWHLGEVISAKNMTYNYVGFSGNRVLKIGFDPNLISLEIKSLKHFQSVQIFSYDYNAILMERCFPGTTLDVLVPQEDFKATEIAIDLMKRIYESSDVFTTHVSDLLQKIYLDWPTLPQEYLKKARLWSDELLSISNESFVLHGDFHHGNILQSQNQYVVIDPQPVMGDRCYDMASFIRNPLKKINQNSSLILPRIKQFSQNFEIEEMRIKKWCFVRGILSACWRLEDGQNPRDILKFCEFILKGI